MTLTAAQKAALNDLSKRFPELALPNTGGDLLLLGDLISGLETVKASFDLITASAAELNQLDASVAPVMTEGVGQPLRHAIATYDFAVDGGAIGAKNLGDPLPDNAIILGGFVEVETTCTSATDAGTGALHVEGANDIVSAKAISAAGDDWDAGRQPIIPKFNTPESTAIKLTAARRVQFTVAVEAFTAGKFHVHLFYAMGHA